MSTLALPSWFTVAHCEASLKPEVRGFPGPFGGPSEVYDLVGDRWRLRLTLQDGDFAAGAQSEALFNRLRGGADWLYLHHFARPVPRGTARGSITLAASAAQGASSLQLAGLLATPNLIAGGGFELDGNADGLADGWTLYSSGTTGGVTTAMPSAAGNTGTVGLCQRVSAAGLNGSVGISRSVAVQAGASYALSATQSATAGVTVSLEIAWYSSAPAYISSATASAVASNGRRSVVGVAPSNAATATIYVYITSAAGTAAELNVDEAQFELGTAATSYAGLATLLAGDMLGHGSEQLVQVYEDATATDAGAVTITLTNRVRKTIASGQTIAWSAPQVPFMLMDPTGVPTAYGNGRVPGQVVEFLEAWGA